MLKAILRLMGCAALLFIHCHAAYAAEMAPEPTEYEIKAVFIYNFMKFVEWPSSAFHDAAAPIVLCVMGDDRCFTVMQDLEGRTAQGRKVVVRQLSGTKEPEACHVFFLCQSAKGQMDEMARLFKDSNVLMVGEMPGFATSGGAINFIREDSKVRFEINMDACVRAGLKVSSRLLSLARIVKGTPR